MPLLQLPPFLSACFADICAALDRRSAPPLIRLLVGALFAKGRRTVTSWFRAAAITTDFRPAYNALWAAGEAEALAYRLLCLALKPLMRQLAGDHLLFAIDATPTARYGPKVQAAGIHHNPTPGPAGEKFIYGHIWVTLAWLVRHPAWDTLALPLRALLYVRVKDVPKLAKRYPWTFAPKLELAVALVRWLCVWMGGRGKQLRVVVDGAYAKRPFLRPVMALGVVVFSRLRKDAHLLSLPPSQRRRGQGGPLPRYGKERIGADEQCGGASVASGGDLAEVVVRYAVGRGEPVCRAVADGAGNLSAATAERVTYQVPKVIRGMHRLRREKIGRWLMRVELQDGSYPFSRTEAVIWK